MSSPRWGTELAETLGRLRGRPALAPPSQSRALRGAAWTSPGWVSGIWGWGPAIRGHLSTSQELGCRPHLPREALQPGQRARQPCPPACSGDFLFLFLLSWEVAIRFHLLSQIVLPEHFGSPGHLRTGVLDAPVATLSVKMRVGGGGRHCPRWGPGGDKPPPAARRAQLVGLSRPRSDIRVTPRASDPGGARGCLSGVTTGGSVQEK